MTTTTSHFLVVGVFADGSLSSSAQAIFTPEFQSNKFLKNNKWVDQTRSVEVSLLNVDQVFASGFELKANIEKIFFVGVAPKDKKPLENSSVLDIASQYSQQAVNGQQDKVTLNHSIRTQITPLVDSIKKEKKDDKFVIHFDDFNGHAQAVAEAAALGTWKFDLNFDKFLNPIFGKEGFLLTAFKLIPSASSSQHDFKVGIITGSSQVFSRYILELPANYCTPIKYCELVKLKIEKYTLFASQEFISSKLQVNVYDEDWAKNKGMGSFLSVTAGTSAPARVLELVYNNNSNKKQDEYDLAILGKGITFDSGGISLKPGEGMKDMKGDCGGSSAGFSAALGALELELPLNIITVGMLCENMPGPDATKPGDVVVAMNGKTIEVDNTDAEGRLILADGLCYLSEKKPEVLLDMATLTGAVIIALSHVTAAVFTNSHDLFADLEKASYQTNDYLWRMPIFRDDYLGQMKSDTSDLNNIGGRPGGSCTAATFLSEFVDFTKVKKWAHLDIAAVTQTKTGYTGRPTRAIIQYLQQLSK